MPTKNTPATALEDWKTILGDKVELSDESAWRDLWPVTAEDGARYFLKRLGPWRNLPVADEARILRHLAMQGVRVAEFLPTDRATLIHGDLTPENVLLRPPGAVSGFIDFDHLPIAPRIWDIAKYLSRRIRMRWRQGVPVSGRDRTDHLAGFLIGYQKKSPLKSGEIEALPAGIAASNVLETSYHQHVLAGTLSRRRLPDHEAVLADSAEAAGWNLANYEEVAAVVRSSLV